MIDFPIPTKSASSFREASKALRRYLLSHDIKSVLHGISGGPDSVLALYCLAEAGSVIPGFRLGAAHANFQLRGAESQRDEEFVRTLSTSLPEIQYFFRNFATEEYASRKKVSIEMAARELRHQWWDEICSEYGYKLIATGHNADDNKETLLLNLFRGASPRGLRGMLPLGNRIFRPLLGLSRIAIIRLLDDYYASHPCPINNNATNRPLHFVTDSTNLQSDYRRNFLRNEIIPRLRQRWAGIDTSLNTALELQAEASDLIDFSVREFLNHHKVDESNEISYRALREFPAPLTLIYNWLRPHGLSSYMAREITAHIPSADKYFSPGSFWTLDDGSRIVTTPEVFRLEKKIESDPANIFGFSIPQTEEWTILPYSPVLMTKIKAADNFEIYLPYPPENYEWRRPKEGDRIMLFPDRKNRKTSKLLSDVLKEAGIPMAIRSTIPILANKLTGEIIWIPGIRRSGTDLINENTPLIYHLNLHK